MSSAMEDSVKRLSIAKNVGIMTKQSDDRP